MNAPPCLRLAATAAVLSLAAAASAADLPVHTTLPGGAEIVVLPDPAALTASLRCAIRVGSRHDPPGKEGLAHVVEHLLLRARGADGLDLVEAARAAGAHLNAYTSRDSTIYVLDAPAETFPALAERLLRAITSIHPRPADVARELAVIEREAEYRGGAIGLVEEVLFRTRAAEGTTLGNAASRDRITPDDVVGFHQAAYSSAATTLVVAGAIAAADATSLLRRAWALPASAGEPPRRAAEVEPELPVEERIRAPFLAAVYGYRLDPADRDLCRTVAEILDLRFVAVTSRRPLVRSLDVACVTLRGVDFLLASAHAPTLDATDLPDMMEKVFRKVATHPPGKEERRAVELRMSRVDDAVREDPAALASEVAQAAARRRAAGPTPLPGSSAAAVQVERVTAMARRNFLPARRVVVLLSPFEG